MCTIHVAIGRALKWRVSSSGPRFQVSQVSYFRSSVMPQNNIYTEPPPLAADVPLRIYSNPICPFVQVRDGGLGASKYGGLRVSEQRWKVSCPLVEEIHKEMVV